MIIRDEVYGTIRFSELEKQIVDSREFQRLRKIRQMALTYLVYPCANHTRFEHAIGSMHLAGVMSSRLGLSNDEIERIRLYALLHDIGHVAFSHESERVLEKYLGNHEEIGRKKIASGELKDIITQQFSVDEILSLEEDPLGAIVHSDFGADRMDYLKRDAKNTGVAYGVIDSDRLLHMLLLEDGELCISEGGLEAAESLIIARFMMFSTVYFHKTVRIAAAMLGQSITDAISSKAMVPSQFLSLGDDDALNLLMSSSKSDLASRLENRNLYKAALELELHEESDVKKWARTLKLPILVDFPNMTYKSVHFNVKTEDGNLVSLTEMSDLINSLKQAQEKRMRILVMCDKSDIGGVVSSWNSF